MQLTVFNFFFFFTLQVEFGYSDNHRANRKVVNLEGVKVKNLDARFGKAVDIKNWFSPLDVFIRDSKVIQCSSTEATIGIAQMTDSYFDAGEILSSRLHLKDVEFSSNAGGHFGILHVMKMAVQNHGG